MSVMSKPLIGILGNYHLINNQYPVQGAAEMIVAAVSEICGGLSLIIPSLPKYSCTEDLIEIFDGFICTGGRPNIHPSFYGVAETEAHGQFDKNRDTVALPLIRGAVAAGKPILGICRGFQEFNVAFGGTLHPEIRDLPGRINHRMPPDGSLEEKFALRHEVNFNGGGCFEKIFGSSKVMVNSLHGQGIDKAGERIVIDGYASDGTPEALFVEGACSFSLAVQWHPEWNAVEDHVSSSLFSAFANSLN